MMRTFSRRLVVAVLALAWAHTASAQTADEVIEKSIAAMGGRAAHEKGTAHEWTADEARNAGRKGGQVSRGGRGRLIVPDEATSGTISDSTAADRVE